MRQKTVFLIDDDSDDLQFMRDALSRLDSSIICESFVDPEEAIRRLAKNLIIVPDYIFIDRNMPKVTGEECLQILRADARFQATAIILCSTSMPREVSESLVKAGASFTFRKPDTESGYTVLLRDIIQGTILSA
jgi:CheY-like chemotaxis protein